MRMVRDQLGKDAVGVLEEMMERLEKGEDAGVIDAEIVAEAAPTTVSATTTAAEPKPEPKREPEPNAG